MVTCSNDAYRLPRRLTNPLEHYPYDYGVDVPKDDLLPHPQFSTQKFDALFMQLDTEHTDPVKPKSHHFDLLQILSVPSLWANPRLLKMIYGMQSRPLLMLQKALMTPCPWNLLIFL